MSNENEETMDQESTGEEKVDELSLLKERADIMGITYHPNIGKEKLRAKIEDKKAGVVDPEQAAEEAATIEAAQASGAAETFTPMVKETAAQITARKRKEALRLVRVRVTNMNPLKGNLKGDIFSVGNAQIGMVKKFVPYNAEQGWHVPQIILTHMQSKKYMTHYETKVGNKKIKRHRLVPELSIEILPPLTAKELEALKQRQLMAAGGQ